MIWLAEDENWVRVITYDYVMGIPTWTERDKSHIGDRYSYHEFCAEPNTILWLVPEMAQHLAQKRAVFLPGERHSEREGYIPVMDREKERSNEKKKPTYVRGGRRRRKRRGVWDGQSVTVRYA